MAKLLRTNADGTQVLVQPSFSKAFSLAKMTGSFKITMWIGVFILILIPIFLVLLKTDIIAPGVGEVWPNYVAFTLGVVGLMLILAKPTQIMVDNEKWISKEEYDQRLKEDTLEEIFTRRW